MSNPTWEAFVDGLVDHYAQRAVSDRTLWRVTKAIARSSAVSASARQTALSASSFVSSTTARSFAPKSTTERVAFYRRVEESRAMLEAEGWTLTA